MPYRNKTYICFDADTDMWAYAFMKGWKANDRIDFDFQNAHDLNVLRPDSNEQTVKAKLRERLKAAKILMVLIGEKTKNLHRFVRWEQEVALELGIPIVAVNLNKTNGLDYNLCPPVIRDELVLHIPFSLEDCKWAIDNWPGRYIVHKNNKQSGPFKLKG
jgi:hypothetical protein